MKSKAGRILLLVPGLVLILIGLLGLLSGPRLLQYAYTPGGEDAEAAMREAEKRWDSVFQPVCVYGISAQVSVSEGNTSQEKVTLYQVGGNFFQTYPRVFSAGRPLSPGDSGSDVIVLDEQLAFLLFGDRDPLGKKVQIGDAALTVAGVCRHARRIGESGEYAAFIPLNVKDAPQRDIMVLAAGGNASGSAGTMFETTAGELFGKGEFLNLFRERIRSLVILLVLLATVTVCLMVFLSGKLRALCRRWYEEIRGKLKLKYPRQMFFEILLKGMAAVILWAAFAGIGAGLVMVLSELMKIFPEWVPEELLSISALVRRFWTLVSEAARTVRWSTPEMAEIRFFGGLIRWGVMGLLLGVLCNSLRGGEKGAGKDSV